jgi:flagellar biogenesis protein FliO
MKGTHVMRITKCAVTIKRDYLARIWQWLTALGRSHPSRQLRLQETLALGERRFLAVVEFERQKFLIAGTGNSVAMLSPLPTEWSAKVNPEPEAAHEHEEVPTWEFASGGTGRQLIRR